MSDASSTCANVPYSSASTGTRAKQLYLPSLSSAVLRWSLPRILNSTRTCPDAHSTEFDQLPVQFDSPQQYAQLLHPLLLQEVNAQLQQAASAASEGDCSSRHVQLVHISSNRKRRPPLDMAVAAESSNCQPLYLKFVTQQGGQLQQAVAAIAAAAVSGSGGDDNRVQVGEVRPNDLVLLCNQKVATTQALTSELTQPGTLHALAWVTQVAAGATADTDRAESSTSSLEGSRSLTSTAADGSSIKVQVLQFWRCASGFAGPGVARLAVDSDTAGASWDIIQGVELEQLLKAEQQRTSSDWFMLPLVTLATANRIAEALQTVSKTSKPPPLLKQVLAHHAAHFKPLDSQIQQVSDVSSRMDRRPGGAARGSNSGLVAVASCYCHSRGLNASQVDAVVQVARAVSQTASSAGSSNASSDSWLQRDSHHAVSIGGGLIHSSIPTAQVQSSAQQAKVILLQGPPGTGKTSTVVPMLQLLAESGHRVLACAPTNIAIAEVAQKLLTDLQQERICTQHVYNGCSRCADNLAVVARDPKPMQVRIAGHRVRETGSNKSSSAVAGPSETAGKSPYFPSSSSATRLSHVVLVHSIGGNSNAQAAAEQLSAISLHDRTERLIDAAGLLGWKHQVKQLQEFFETAPALFEQQQQEQQQAHSCDHAGSSTYRRPDRDISIRREASACSDSFWDWCGGQLQRRLEALLPLTETLLQELPDTYFEDTKCQESLQVLAGFIESLGSLHSLLLSAGESSAARVDQDTGKFSADLTKKAQKILKQWWLENLTASSKDTSNQGTTDTPSMTTKAAHHSIGSSSELPPAVASMAAQLLSCSSATAQALSCTRLTIPPAVARCIPGSSVNFSSDAVQQLQHDIMQAASLVMSTVSMAGSSAMNDAGQFDLCVIDEAAQLVEAETCIVLARWPDLRALMLVGDHKQLPATVISQQAQARGYARSLFERPVQRGHRLHLLNTQYRMHVDISSFPCRTFYSNDVQDGNNVKQPSYGRYLQCHQEYRSLGHYCFLNITGREHRGEAGASTVSAASRPSTSICNEEEALAVVALLRGLSRSLTRQLQTVAGKSAGESPAKQAAITAQGPLTAASSVGTSAEQATGPDSKRRVSVGVISPYSLQVQVLQYLLDELGFLPRLDVKVSTVDGFQGQEKDVIVISTVRCTQRAISTFAQDERRLNVAITRGRHAVWVVGSAATLCRGGSIWSDLVADAKSRKAYVEATDIQALQSKLLTFASTHEQLLQLFASSVWKVKLTVTFLRQITLKVNERTKKSALHHIFQLANGKRHTGKRQLQQQETMRRELLDNFGPWCSRLVQVEPVGHGSDTWLVWHVDVDRHADEGKQTVTQVLVAYALVAAHQLPATLQQLQKLLSYYSPQLLEMCSHKQVMTSSAKTTAHVVPCSWPKADVSCWRLSPAEVAAAQVAADQEKQSAVVAAAEARRQAAALAEDAHQTLRLLRVDKGLAEQLLLSSKGEVLDFPFELSPDQQQFAAHPLSALAVGRSGTGKTTALESRLYMEELRSQKAGLPKPRQLLVTASPKLAYALQRSIKAKIATLQKQGNASKAAAALANDEGSCTEHEKSEQQAAEVEAGEDADDADMLDDYTVRRLQAKLPSKFCELSTEHMPFVLTFDQLLSMLDAQLDTPFMQWIKTGATVDIRGSALFEAGDEEGRAADEQGVGDMLYDHMAQQDIDDWDAVLDGAHPDQPPEAIHGSAKPRQQAAAAGHSAAAGLTAARPMAEGSRGFLATARPVSMATASLQQYERVDFQLFQTAYWPRFNTDLRRKLDAALVFSEILGVIKGSVEATLSPAGRLSQAEYLQLAEQRSSNLDQQQRQMVYEVFLRYERLKGQAWQYDIMDWVWYVQQKFAAAQTAGNPLVPLELQMAHVYVDEVQDLTLGQLFMLTHICSQFATGFDFVGDTAQTIAKGVVFRFERIRDLFYKYFKPAALLQQQLAASASSSAATAAGQPGPKQDHFADALASDQHASSTADPVSDGTDSAWEGVKPKLFQLVENYRTHQGVVDVAHNAAIRPLLAFFPYSIDKLQPERAITAGQLPLLIMSAASGGIDAGDSNNSGSNRSAASPLQLLFRQSVVTQKAVPYGYSAGSSNSQHSSRGKGGKRHRHKAQAAGLVHGGSDSVSEGLTVQFGADQVVLVANETTKAAVHAQLGEDALVMTVQESKGLEFKTVLLYNLITDSTFTAWRVLYTYLKDHVWMQDHPPAGSSSSTSQYSSPPFSPQRHYQLQAELKQLYVAATRAMVQLVWFEGDEAKAQPMRDLLVTQGLVSQQLLNDQLTGLLAQSSTAAEWKARGQHLFREDMFPQAATCFRKAGESSLAAFAQACSCQQQAKAKHRLGQAAAAAELFSKSADLFMQAGKLMQAGECLELGGRWQEAAILYRDQCNPPELDKAADCLIQAACWEDAVRVIAQLVQRGLDSLCVSASQAADDTGLTPTEHDEEDAKAVAQSTTICTAEAVQRLHQLLHLLYNCCSRDVQQLSQEGLALLDQWVLQIAALGQVDGPSIAASQVSACTDTASGHSGKISAVAVNQGLGQLHDLLQTLHRGLLYRLVLAYHQVQAVDLMTAALRRLPPRERRKFLERRAYWDLLLDMERQEKNWLRVAQVLLAQNKPAEAATVYEQAEEHLAAAGTLLMLARNNLFWGHSKQQPTPSLWHPKASKALINQLQHVNQLLQDTAPVAASYDLLQNADGFARLGRAELQHQADVLLQFATGGLEDANKLEQLWRICGIPQISSSSSAGDKVSSCKLNLLGVIVSAAAVDLWVNRLTALLPKAQHSLQPVCLSGDVQVTDTLTAAAEQLLHWWKCHQSVSCGLQSQLLLLKHGESGGAHIATEQQQLAFWGLLGLKPSDIQPGILLVEAPDRSNPDCWLPSGAVRKAHIKDSPQVELSVAATAVVDKLLRPKLLKQSRSAVAVLHHVYGATAKLHVCWLGANSTAAASTGGSARRSQQAQKGSQSLPDSSNKGTASVPVKLQAIVSFGQWQVQSFLHSQQPPTAGQMRETVSCAEQLLTCCLRNDSCAIGSAQLVQLLHYLDEHSTQESLVAVVKQVLEGDLPVYGIATASPASASRSDNMGSTKQVNSNVWARAERHQHQQQQQFLQSEQEYKRTGSLQCSPQYMVNTATALLLLQPQLPPDYFHQLCKTGLVPPSPAALVADAHQVHMPAGQITALQNLWIACSWVQYALMMDPVAWKPAAAQPLPQPHYCYTRCMTQAAMALLRLFSTPAHYQQTAQGSGPDIRAGAYPLPHQHCSHGPSASALILPEVCPLLLLRLLEQSCVALCAMTTRLHNMVLPKGLLISCMGGQGLQQMFSWLKVTNIKQWQKEQLQGEMIDLAICLQGLLLMPYEERRRWLDASLSNKGGATASSSRATTAAAADPARAVLDSVLLTRVLVLLLMLAVHAPGDGREIKNVILQTLAPLLQPQRQHHQARPYTGSRSFHSQTNSGLDTFKPLPPKVLKVTMDLAPAGRRQISNLRKQGEVVEVFSELLRGLGDNAVMTIQRATRPTTWRPEALRVEKIPIDQSCLGPQWFSLAMIDSNGGYLTPREQQQLKAADVDQIPSMSVADQQLQHGLADEDDDDAADGDGAKDAEVVAAEVDVEVPTVSVSTWVRQQLSRWLCRSRHLLKVDELTMERRLQLLAARVFRHRDISNPPYMALYTTRACKLQAAGMLVLKEMISMERELRSVAAKGGHASTTQSCHLQQSSIKGTLTELLQLPPLNVASSSSNTITISGKAVHVMSRLQLNPASQSGKPAAVAYVGVAADPGEVLDMLLDLREDLSPLIRQLSPWHTCHRNQDVDSLEAAMNMVESLCRQFLELLAQVARRSTTKGQVS